MNKTSHHAVSVTQFPAKQPLPTVSIHKPRHKGSQNVSTKNSSNNIFLLFSGSSSASKYQYQFNDMLSVINAEFTCTKHSSDDVFADNEIVIEDEHHTIGLFLIQSNRGSRSITLIEQYLRTTFEGSYE